MARMAWQSYVKNVPTEFLAILFCRLTSTQFFMTEVFFFVMLWLVKACCLCKCEFEITSDDRAFLEKFDVPDPKLCPDCRNQRRLSFRNDRHFYKRNCDLCKKVIVSICSPDKPFPVYCKECYLSDAFDPLAYGIEYNPARSFLEQFMEMRARLPRVANYFTQCENCDYTVHTGNSRNCYMGASFVNCENCYYSDWLFYAKDCSDLYICQTMERCYECFQCEQCYNSAWLENCMNVNFSAFCSDCRSCQNMLGCAGQRQKSFMILNMPVGKEEFDLTWKKLMTDATFRAEFRDHFETLKLKTPVKSTWDKNSENCSGNYIVNSRNAKGCYAVKDVEDAQYAYEVGGLKDGMDVTRCARGEMVYDVTALIDLKFSKFCNLCYQSSNLEYCDSCQSSHNCFGCMGLKGHHYCILNKQYTPEDYAALVKDIRTAMKACGEYGEFFPASFSVYGYNETKAYDFYPLTKEQALAEGLKWRDLDPSPRGLDNASICEQCGKNFRIIAQELKIYQTLGVPQPTHCFNCRQLKRMALETPRHLWDRCCGKCGISIRTTYSPDRPEIVYCHSCYLKSIV